MSASVTVSLSTYEGEVEALLVPRIVPHCPQPLAAISVGISTFLNELLMHRGWGI